LEKGTVLALDPRKLRMVVSVDGDSCSVFELGAAYDVQVGHRLRGNLESELCFALENLSTAEMLDVTWVGHYATADEAKRAIGL
jgi:hypothetical protein